MCIYWLAAATTRPVGFTADQVLSPYIYVFYAAFLVAFIFTPVMKAVASYYGIIDEPDRIRKMHSHPVAYLGGIAVFLGWMAGLALSQFVGMHFVMPGGPTHPVVSFSIVLGGAVIIGLGLWDDIRGIGPWVKIGGQILAAVFLLWHGIGTHCTEFLFEPVKAEMLHHLGFSFINPVLIKVSSCLLTVFIVVACCNAANLMDGLDGLCGGVTAIIAAGMCFIAVSIAKAPFGIQFDANLDALRVVLALALLGSVLGFVPFNFNPASIFMGDTGSMFLGFSCATLIILSAERTEPKWLLASLVMFAVPLMDTAMAFARRAINRRHLFSADKYHFHHQMVARGLTVRQTVMVVYGLTLFCVIGGAALAYLRTRYVVAAYLVIFGFMMVAAVKMGMVHEKPRATPRRAAEGGAQPGIPQEATALAEIREK